MSENWETLKGDWRQVTIWQETEDAGVPAPAIQIRTYSGVVGIKQGDNEVLLNPETIPVLCKALRKLLA